MVGGLLLVFAFIAPWLIFIMGSTSSVLVAPVVHSLR
jgi:hypothetical protein